MPTYDAAKFDPPAPVANVTFPSSWRSFLHRRKFGQQAAIDSGAGSQARRKRRAHLRRRQPRQVNLPFAEKPVLRVLMGVWMVTSGA